MNKNELIELRNYRDNAKYITDIHIPKEIAALEAKQQIHREYMYKFDELISAAEKVED